MKKRYIAIFLALGIVIGAGGGIGGTIAYNKLSEDDTSSKYYVEYKPYYDLEKGCRVTPDDVDEYKKHYSFPDEILDGDTEQLLKALLNTDLLYNCSYPFLASSYEIACLFRLNIYDHEGYLELIRRADLLKTLDNYAKEVLDDKSGLTQENRDFFKVIVDSGAVRDRIDYYVNTKDEFPNLYSIYSTLTERPYFPDSGSSSLNETNS